MINFTNLIYKKRKKYNERPFTLSNLSLSVSNDIKHYIKNCAEWKKKQALNLFSENCKNKIFFEKKEIKEREKKERERKNGNKEILFFTLNQLNNCFTINKNVKQKAYEYDAIADYTTVDFNLKNKMYTDKTAIIIQCISYIQKYRLPIKYGKNDSIVYFEYCGKQVSFHDPKKMIFCKKFKGEWNLQKNSKIPFGYAKKITN